jgi:hypothetical protein
MYRLHIIHVVNNIILTLTLIITNIIIAIHALWPVICPQDYTQLGFSLNGVIIRIFITLSETISFWLFVLWFYHPCINLLKNMALYKVLTIPGEFWMLVSNLIFIRNSTLVFFLIVIIDNVLSCFFYSILVCSEGNIVDHISSKHKLTWCCLQSCMIGASNSLVTMQLIEGSNQMKIIFFVLLDFHDFSLIKWWENAVDNFVYSLNYCIFFCKVDCDL